MEQPFESLSSFTTLRPNPWPKRKGLEQALQSWRQDSRHQKCLVYDELRPKSDARWSPLPDGLGPRLRQALLLAGRDQLYTHQAAAFAAVQRGQHVVLATPTASGKSLGYNLPVLEALSGDPGARALYLFPTKALSRDQEEAMRLLVGQMGMSTGVITYDGDTPGEIRRAAREQGGVLLTNPDMLHSGILPHHTSWSRFFSGLKFIVIDELHHYRGIFGSHVANVLRRLKRVASFYGASPQFICASATIANAQEHAETIIGHKVTAIADSGAPKNPQHIMIYNPPELNSALGLRQNVYKTAVKLTLELLRQGVTTIVFGQSRNSVEVMLKYLRDGVSAIPGLNPESIHSYRGGYLPATRREIERKLRAGEIKCVVATQALELGIDIGALEAVVCAGYPGSISALWQRFGRGGRRGKASLSLLVTSSSPLDQYFALTPDKLLQAPIEHARIDPNNIEIYVQHVKCAAFELPFSEHETLGSADHDTTRAALEFLAEHQTLHPVNEDNSKVYHWASQSSPAASVSLRQIGWDNFVIIDIKDDTVIAEMDWRSAHTMLHEQAIYQHVAAQYQVERLDYDNRKAFVRQVHPDYYTDAMTHIKITPTDVFVRQPKPWSRSSHAVLSWGEISVVEKVVGFKKIRYHTHENVGFGEVNLPEMQKHTTAMWLMATDTLLNLMSEKFGVSRAWLVDGLRGLAHALHTVACVGLMIDPRDLGQSVIDEPTQDQGEHEFSPTLYLWDQVPGGLGLAERLFTSSEELMYRAGQLVQACGCEGGCPRCVGLGGLPGESDGRGSRRKATLSILEEIGHGFST